MRNEKPWPDSGNIRIETAVESETITIVGAQSARGWFLVDCEFNMRTLIGGSANGTLGPLLYCQESLNIAALRKRATLPLFERPA